MNLVLNQISRTVLCYIHIVLSSVAILFGLISNSDCVGNTEDGWEKRWVKSDWKRDESLAGEWNYTSGKWHGDANDKGKALVESIV